MREVGVEASEFSTERVDALLRFARALTLDRAQAEDLVQDVLLRLLTVDSAQIRDIDAYARRMLVNRYVSWRRRVAVRRTVVLIDDRQLGVVPDPGERYAELAEIRSRLTALSHKQRAVIVLRFFADQDDAQIAATLGCTVNAVRLLVSRGLAALRVTEAEQPDRTGAKTEGANTR